MGLAASLGSSLDCSGLGGQLLSNLAGPAGNLQAVSAPADSGRLGQIGGAGTVDLAGVLGSVAALAEAAAPAIANFPAANDIFGPILSAVELLENNQVQDLPDQVTALLQRLRDELQTPPEGGHLALLMRLLEVLGGSDQTQVFKRLLAPLLDAAGIRLPAAGAVTDPLAAAAGGLALLGGAMSLETVLADAQRLATAMASTIDAGALARDLAALEQLVAGDGVSLAAFATSLDIADPAALASARRAVADVAARLDLLPERLNAAMGLAEATLVYLDIDRLQAEIDAAKAAVRAADLDPLGRVAGRLSGLLTPLLRIDPASLPAGQLSQLFARVEAEVGSIAASIAAIDTAGFVAPLTSGIATLTAPLRELDRLIETAIAALRTALQTVRDAIAGLPFQAIADAVRGFLQPIADLLDAIRALLDEIEADLGQAAQTATDAIGEIDGHLDDFKSSIDGFFAAAKQLVDAVDLDQIKADIAQNIQTFADTLAKAQMKPYFDTAVGAIGGAAQVVSAVPFNLLPDSMKSDVEAAVKPIRDTDVDAVEAQIESMLGIGADGHFALRPTLEEAISELHQKYLQLVQVLDDNNPRTLLADVDAKLDEIAQRVREISPELSLQPVRDAIDRVRGMLAGIDLDQALAPVQQVFDQIDAQLDAFSPSRLVAPMQQRIASLRDAIVAQLKLDQWSDSLTELRTRAQSTLALASPERLQAPLQAALDEALGLLALFPDLDPSRGLGSLVAGLLGASGLRISPNAFPALRAWIVGESGNVALAARSAAIATAIAATRRATQAIDLETAAPGISTSVSTLRGAVSGLAARLPADSDDRAWFEAVAPRLDLSIAFAGLDGNRTRLLAELDGAATRAEAFVRTGFSEVDAGLTGFRTALAPLAPAWRQVSALATAIGLSPDEISVKGVVSAFLRELPPERLAALPMPIFDALRGRIDTLLGAVLQPLQDAITELRDLLDAIDLDPLAQAADGVVAEVKSQIDSLSPTALLAAPIASFNALRDDLVANDPLAPVLALIDALRDAAAALLAKLSLETLLATPLEIYDRIVEDLRGIDPNGLLDPVFDQLDQIASQVDDGLDRTVTAFKQLQNALPAAA